MNRFLLHSMLVLWMAGALAGCVSKGVQVHKIFQNPKATLPELRQNVEVLKITTRDGSAEERMKAIQALRFLAKNGTDAGRQELALEGLTVVWGIGGSALIQDMAKTRLEALLRSGSEAQRQSVMRVQLRLIQGRLGLLEMQEGKTVFVAPTKEARLKSTQLLLNQLERQPPHLQMEMVEVLGEVLANPVRCLSWSERTPAGCKYYDDKDQQEIKGLILDQIGLWLQEGNLSPVINTQLILHALKTKDLKDPSQISNRLKQWSENNKINKETRLILQAALQKVQGDYTEIYTEAFRARQEAKSKTQTQGKIDWSAQTQDAAKTAQALGEVKKQEVTLTEVAQKDDFLHNSAWADPSQTLSRGFWVTNVEPVLHQQLFTDKEGRPVVPRLWLFSPYYSATPEVLDQRMILHRAALPKLTGDYIVSGKEPLIPLLVKSLEFPANTPPLIKKLQLEVIGGSLDTANRNQEKPFLFFSELDKAMANNQDAWLHGQYLALLFTGLEGYTNQAKPRICQLWPKMDSLEQERWILWLRKDLQRSKKYLDEPNPAQPKAEPTFCGSSLQEPSVKAGLLSDFEPFVVPYDPAQPPLPVGVAPEKVQAEPSKQEKLIEAMEKEALKTGKPAAK